MAYRCPVTKKGTHFGNNRSHALNSTRRRWKVNFQKATITINNRKKTIWLSARAIRTLKRKGHIKS